MGQLPLSSHLPLTGTACAGLERRGVSSAKEFGDRLRDKGAARREVLERSKSANLVRSVSARAEASVKENVDIVRRPSQQLGSHLDTSFKGTCLAVVAVVRCL